MQARFALAVQAEPGTGFDARIYARRADDGPDSRLSEARTFGTFRAARMYRDQRPYLRWYEVVGPLPERCRWPS